MAGMISQSQTTSREVILSVLKELQKGGRGFHARWKGFSRKWISHLGSVSLSRMDKVSKMKDLAWKIKAKKRWRRASTQSMSIMRRQRPSVVNQATMNGGSGM